ncbi:MAG: hypothetical protein ACJAXA_001152 [Candidatus Aldehydirespiratoraceae bacterium]|jgi:hypothetical protein
MVWGNSRIIPDGYSLTTSDCVLVDVIGNTAHGLGISGRQVFESMKYPKLGKSLASNGMVSC